MQLPRHIAIIMDGNGRWAKARGLPRHLGHKDGLGPVRMCIEQCATRGIGALTLFTFSSENWRRPVEEVGSLMSLFLDSLDREVAALDRDGVRITFIGDRHTLSVKLQSRMAEAEHLTKDNVRLRLQLAISYGGRWDILNAVRHVARAALSGSIGVEQIDEAVFTAALALSDVPDPDLFIRTGGEHRISNFLLWNLAYTELYFTDVLWPDFKQADFEAALTAFGARERRFGRTGEQSGAA
ncbi:MAG: di-trans,poly-cis-decaprenylcistransferase [Pseudomonadales bacterium]|nr:di-trans,poly-cis-decaprenylcistransferase [Pseudomonadales bacterium]